QMQVPPEFPIVLSIEAQLIKRKRLDSRCGKVLHQRVACRPIAAGKEVSNREDRGKSCKQNSVVVITQIGAVEVQPEGKAVIAFAEREVIQNLVIGEVLAGRKEPVLSTQWGERIITQRDRRGESGQCRRGIGLLKHCADILS